MECRNYGHCWEDCSTPTETGCENVLPAVSCDVEDRQPREWESKSHKSFIKLGLTEIGTAHFSGDCTTIRLKQPGGGSSFAFGEFMSDEEAQALIVRRPGSECKMREMSGNHIFEHDLRAVSDISGYYPPRPSSSSKASELQGHDIFQAFSNPYHYPSPPKVHPYEPHELPLPPSKLYRIPGKQASQFNLGGPVCIGRDMPKTESAWAKQSELHGSQEKDMDPYHKPVVSAMKARELAGHTNLFGKPPYFSSPRTPTPEHCDVVHDGAENDPVDSAKEVHRIKMRNLAGHNAVFMTNELSCDEGSKPLSLAKAQELRGNDIFASKPELSCASIEPNPDPRCVSPKPDPVQSCATLGRDPDQSSNSCEDW